MPKDKTCSYSKQKIQLSSALPLKQSCSCKDPVSWDTVVPSYVFSLGVILLVHLLYENSTSIQIIFSTEIILKTKEHAAPNSSSLLTSIQRNKRINVTVWACWQMCLVCCDPIWLFLLTAICTQYSQNLWGVFVNKSLSPLQSRDYRVEILG